MMKERHERYSAFRFGSPQFRLGLFTQLRTLLVNECVRRFIYSATKAEPVHRVTIIFWSRQSLSTLPMQIGCCAVSKSKPIYRVRCMGTNLMAISVKHFSPIWRSMEAI